MGLSIFFIWIVANQYSDKGSSAAAIAGSVLFFLGVAFTVNYQLTQTRELQENGRGIFIPESSIVNIERIMRYMEHPDVPETCRRAMIYYDMAITAMQENEGKIVLRHHDGGEESFDPASLEIFPEDDEGEEWKG